MMMNGQLNYEYYMKRYLDEYRVLFDKYNELITSQKYAEIISTMPFEFLNATQLYNKLVLFENLNPKPHMQIHSIEEAKVFYKQLISFKIQSKKLLEDASFICEIGLLVKNLNDYVKNSVYLNDSFLIYENEEVIKLANQCLQVIPDYPKKLTKEFRYNFLESCILSLDTTDLEHLCEVKIIKAEDLDKISLILNQNDYQEKIKFLCMYFEKDAPVIASRSVKISGVTFKNEDGVSRQDILKELQKIIIENPDYKVNLYAEKSTYKPAIGPVEPAIRIMWDNKCLGYLSKDIVSDIYNNYDNPQFKVDFTHITSWNDDKNLGCKINFGIIAPNLIESKENPTPELD